MAVVRQRMLFGTFQQTGVDTFTEFTPNTNLTDSEDFVLKVKSIEVLVPSALSIQFANAVDFRLDITIGTEACIVGTNAFSDAHLLAKFMFVQMGTAAATTDRVTDFHQFFIPPYDLYIPNEQYYIAIQSAGTGQACFFGLRMAVDKIKATTTEKITLKAA